MTLEDSLESVLSGRATLFLGAGFSKGATNRRGNNFKLGWEFAAHLAQLSGAPKESPLQDASEAYRTKFGASALVDELIQEFTATSVSDTHRHLASAPWKRVYTTNYDNVFETACALERLQVHSVLNDSSPLALPKAGLTYIHLNGSIQGLTPPALDSTLKLTDTSYVTASVESSPWGERFREDCRLAETIVFVGYGLSDLDITRLFVAAHPLMAKRTFFVVGDTKDEVLKARLARFGQLIPLSAEQYAQALVEKKRTYIPRSDNSSLQLFSLKEIVAIPATQSPTDRAILDLLELGDVDRTLVASSDTSNRGRYYLERTKVSKTIELLSSSAKVVAVTSALGNGKSLFLEAIYYRALQSGYRIFTAERFEEQAAAEFEYIARLPGKILLVVDNYSRGLDAIAAYCQVENNDARLLVTARQATHDILFERLEKLCKVPAVPEIQIDKLDLREIEWFVDTLEEYGMWRSAAGKPRKARVFIVQNTYHSEIHSLLLGLLESKDIGTRVTELIRKCQKNPTYLEVAASVFVAATIGTVMTIDALADLWGPELISSATFRRDDTIRQLLDFSTWKVTARSSVVSSFALKMVIGVELVPILVKMCEQASRAAPSSPSHFELLRSLHRYSNLQRLLPEAGRRAAAISFYESIKALPQLQRNPLFWLQYAIACFVEGELKRARRYFETAYSLAAAQNFDPYQIDNHFARFLLLESANEDLTIEIAIDKFRRARQIINLQLQKERHDNPFKAAMGYQDFVDKYGTSLTDSMCREISAAADTVLSYIPSLPQHIRSSAALIKCKDMMEYTKARSEQLRIAFERLHATPGKKMTAPKTAPIVPPINKPNPRN